MGDILLTYEQWSGNNHVCPSRDELNNLCSARYFQLDKRCDYDICPYVFWLNAINIEK